MSKPAKSKRKSSKSLDLYYDVDEFNLADILSDIQKHQMNNPGIDMTPKSTSLLDYNEFNRNNDKCYVGAINVNPTFIIHEAPAIEDKGTNHQNLQFYMLFFLAVIAIFISLGLFYMLYRLLKRLETRREENSSHPNPTKTIRLLVESTPHSFMRSPNFVPGGIQTNRVFSNILPIEDATTRVSTGPANGLHQKRPSSVESKGSSTSSTPGLAKNANIEVTPVKHQRSNKNGSSIKDMPKNPDFKQVPIEAIQASAKKPPVQADAILQVSNTSVKGSGENLGEANNLKREADQVKIEEDCSEKYKYLMDFTKQNMTSSRFCLNKHLSTTFTSNNKEMNSMKFLLGETDELPLEDGKFKKSFMKSESIGKGSYGEVYKAVHKLDGKVYAVKRIEMNEYEINDMKKYGVFREVMAMSSINHENIVR